MPSLKVSVVTQIRKVLEEGAGYLRLRTSEGDIGILPNHAPFVAELSYGKMEIESPDKTKRDAYFITGGFLEISNNEATIIADEIFTSDEIDLQFEEAELENQKNFLEKASAEEKKKIEKNIKIFQSKIDFKKNL